MKEYSSATHKRRKLSSEQRRRLKRRRKRIRRIKNALCYLVAAMAAVTVLFIYIFLKKENEGGMPQSTVMASLPEVERIVTQMPEETDSYVEPEISVIVSEEPAADVLIPGCVVRKTIDASSEGTAWISEGKLYLAGGRFMELDVSNWINLREVSVGESHVAAVDENNRVWAVGENRMGQCNIHGLENVRSLTIGMECTVAVMMDGHLRCFGYMPEEWVENLQEETQVVQADMSDTHLILLKNDGTVAIYGSVDSDKKWNDISMVAAGHDFVVGLKENGELTVAGNLKNPKWKDIAYISAGSNHIAAIRRDGTAVATGENLQGQCDVAQWSNLCSIAAGYDHTAALAADGRAFAAGYAGNGQCNVH